MDGEEEPKRLILPCEPSHRHLAELAKEAAAMRENCTLQEAEVLNQRDELDRCNERPLVAESTNSPLHPKAVTEWFAALSEGLL